MMSLFTYLSNQSRSVLIRWGLAAVLIVGGVDYLIVSKLSLVVFYLIPVTVVAAFAGRWAGFTLAFVSAGVWLIADLLGSEQYSYPTVPYWNALARFALFLVVAILQSSLIREKHVARTDFLTGLGNRKVFFEVSGKEIERSRRYNLPLSVIYLDIDNFKAVNDRFGHDAGDRLLQTTADILIKNIRTMDIASRLGGDEFAVLLPQAGADSAFIVLKKLHGLLQDAMKKTEWAATYSCGVVTFLTPPDTVDVMIREADGVMYAAKSSGKNRIKQKVI